MARLSESSGPITVKQTNDPRGSSQQNPGDGNLAGLGIILAQHGRATADIIGPQLIERDNLDEAAAATFGGTALSELAYRGGEKLLGEPVNLDADTTASLALGLYNAISQETSRHN
jgi:hypothetical protein